MVINDAYLPLFEPFDQGVPAAERPAPKFYNVLKGGAGSGKSRACCQFIYYLMTSRERFRVLGLHKYEVSIRDTLYYEMATVIEEEGTAHLFHMTLAPFVITYLPTGSSMIMKGLDNPEKLKSLSGIGLIWMEEATNFSKKEWQQAVLRMRGITPYPYQMLISFNPTSETHWLKSTFFDADTVNPNVAKSLQLIETTFQDNHFLNESYIDQLGSNDDDYKRIYMYGEWGIANPEGLFYKRFNAERVVKGDLPYDPDRAVWLSYDFNVNPHVTCLVAQLQDNDELWVIDEIALPGPRNNTDYTTQEFVKRYPHHEAGIYVTGDPANRHNSSRGEKGYNDYTIIQKGLEGKAMRLKVEEKAPPVVRRGDFINDIFDGRRPGLRILVSPRCKVLLKDFNNQKEGPKGKDKSRVTVNGVSVEKYGHASDAFDYLVCTVWRKEFDEYLAGPKAKVRYLVGKNKPSAKY